MSSDSDDKYFIPKASPRAATDIDMGDVEFSDFVGGPQASTDIFQVGGPTSLPDAPVSPDRSNRDCPRKYSLSDFADRLFRHHNHLEEEIGKKHSRSSPRISGLRNLLTQIYRLRQNTDTSDTTECSTSDVQTTLRNNVNNASQRARLQAKDAEELHMLVNSLTDQVRKTACGLVKQLKLRDRLATRRDKQYDVITAFIQALSLKRSQDTRMRFSVGPLPGDSGFAQWHDAMKMVSRLPGGIPNEFRRTLWLTLAEQHLQRRQVNWAQIENYCFNEWSNPDDDELGAQIVKDLHRTGCSSFCGENAEHNQFLLKKVLLAYARWNKVVGYCQGFNMLAALILEVMDKKEGDSLKVMIYLIEGLLPEGYFTQSLKGLSVDMAVFRDLLRMRLPNLSQHLDLLQHDARDNTSGTSYEPPLTNVFTMQWFLTMFCTCLPQSTVLRVWDLVFLEGNEVLLRTALAIWDGLADRIMGVDSADEFYCIMGVLTREMLEFGLMNANRLVETIVQMAPFPFPGLGEIRDKYTYNITPWTQSVSTVAKRGLRLFYSDDDEEEDDDEKIAVAAALSAVFRSKASSPQTNYPRHDRLNLDISALKKQYSKLRERQRQTHVVLTGTTKAVNDSSSKAGQTIMNHLLLGRKPLKRHSISNNPHAPPPGPTIIPQVKPYLQNKKPSVKKSSVSNTTKAKIKDQYPIKQTFVEIKVLSDTTIKAKSPIGESGETLHWRDTKRTTPRVGEKEVHFVEKEENNDKKSTGTSTSTELCDDDLGHISDLEEDLQASQTTPPSQPPSEVILDPQNTDQGEASELMFSLDLHTPSGSTNDDVHVTRCDDSKAVSDDLAVQLLKMRAQLENIFGEKLRSSVSDGDSSPPEYTHWKDNPNYKWLFPDSGDGLTLTIPHDDVTIKVGEITDKVNIAEGAVLEGHEAASDLIDFSDECVTSDKCDSTACEVVSQTIGDDSGDPNFPHPQGDLTSERDTDNDSCLRVEVGDSRISFLDIRAREDATSLDLTLLPIQGTFMCHPLDPSHDVSELSSVTLEPDEFEATPIQNICTKEILFFPETGASIEATSLLFGSDVDSRVLSEVLSGPRLSHATDQQSRAHTFSRENPSDGNDPIRMRTCSDSDIYKNSLKETSADVEREEGVTVETGEFRDVAVDDAEAITLSKPFYIQKKDGSSTIDACRKFLKRRNSEKALRIIQENLEIMGKIQKQPSVLPIHEGQKPDTNKVETPTCDVPHDTPSSMEASPSMSLSTSLPPAASLNQSNSLESQLPLEPPTTPVQSLNTPSPVEPSLSRSISTPSSVEPSLSRSLGTEAEIEATHRRRTQSLQISAPPPPGTVFNNSLRNLPTGSGESKTPTTASTKTQGFNPFPRRQAQHKEVGIKLGLYAKCDSSSSKPKS